MTKVDVWIQSATGERPCSVFFRTEADGNFTSTMEVRLTRDELLEIRGRIDRVLEETKR